VEVGGLDNIGIRRPRTIVVTIAVIRRIENDRQTVVLSQQALHRVHAVHARHRDIGDQHVDPLLVALAGLQSLFSTGCGDDRVPGKLEAPAGELPDRRLVLHQEHAFERHDRIPQPRKEAIGDSMYR